MQLNNKTTWSVNLIQFNNEFYNILYFNHYIYSLNVSYMQISLDGNSSHLGVGLKKMTCHSTERHTLNQEILVDID